MVERFIYFPLLCFILLWMGTSCAAEKKVQRTLIGVWDIVAYEDRQEGQKASTASNIGTIEFKKDGIGENNLRLDFLGTQKREQNTFTWSNTAEEVSIKGSSESALSKTWIIIENKGKRQTWKSTDGGNKTQKIMLRKQS